MRRPGGGHSGGGHYGGADSGADATYNSGHQTMQQQHQQQQQMKSEHHQQWRWERESPKIPTNSMSPNMFPEGNFFVESSSVLLIITCCFVDKLIKIFIFQIPFTDFP